MLSIVKGPDSCYLVHPTPTFHQLVWFKHSIRPRLNLRLLFPPPIRHQQRHGPSSFVPQADFTVWY